MGTIPEVTQGVDVGSSNKKMSLSTEGMVVGSACSPPG